MSTTDRVLEILLGEGGYRELPRPLRVGTISFDFTHALVAETRANDLVIVIELTGSTADEGVTRKVLALTRALDVMGSKRPVTAVLTSGQPRLETVQAISKVCRVLSVGAPAGPGAREAVRDWLAVLLPLVQPSGVDTQLDWEAELRASSAASVKSEFLDRVIGAAPRGRAAVEAMLANAICGPVDAALGDDEGEKDGE